MSHQRVIVSLALIFVLLLAGEFGYRHFIGRDQAGHPVAPLLPVADPVAQGQSGQGGPQEGAQPLFAGAASDRQSPPPRTMSGLPIGHRAWWDWLGTGGPRRTPIRLSTGMLGIPDPSG